MGKAKSYEDSVFLGNSAAFVGSATGVGSGLGVAQKRDGWHAEVRDDDSVHFVADPPTSAPMKPRPCRLGGDRYRFMYDEENSGMYWLIGDDDGFKYPIKIFKRNAEMSYVINVVSVFICRSRSEDAAPLTLDVVGSQEVNPSGVIGMTLPNHSPESSPVPPNDLSNYTHWKLPTSDLLNKLYEKLSHHVDMPDKVGDYYGRDKDNKRIIFFFFSRILTFLILVLICLFRIVHGAVFFFFALWLFCDVLFFFFIVDPTSKGPGRLWRLEIKRNHGQGRIEGGWP